MVRASDCNVKVASVLGSIPICSDTVEYDRTNIEKNLLPGVCVEDGHLLLASGHYTGVTVSHTRHIVDTVQVLVTRLDTWIIS